ncbi:MAG: VC0807 family protein [bacterium]
MQKKENNFLSLIINILVPTIILMKFSTPDTLGPTQGFVLALLLPLSYGLYDGLKNKRWNLIAIIGLVSIVLTGGIGLLHLNAKWLAVKEAAIPGMIAIIIFATIPTRFSILKMILDKVIDQKVLAKHLEKVSDKQYYSNCCKRYSYLLGLSFLVSSILNYVLARSIVVSQAGSTQFAEELGRLTALSFVIIAIPSTCFLALIFYLILRDLNKISGLKLEELIIKK